MEKVYIVKECYLYGREIDANVNVYNSKDKAMVKFKQMVEAEKNNSWLRDVINWSEDSYDFEETETTLYCCDYDDGNITYITVEEKEVL